MRKKEGEVLWLRIIVQGLVREQGENFLLSKGLVRERRMYGVLCTEKERRKEHTANKND